MIITLVKKKNWFISSMKALSKNLSPATSYRIIHHRLLIA